MRATSLVDRITSGEEIPRSKVKVVSHRWLQVDHIELCSITHETCLSELPVNDAKCGFNSPRSFLFLPHIPTLRYCDAFVNKFTAAEFQICIVYAS
ncbi:hypothetical protein EVAR_27639_1 [Eumeta japonica]|uniref:Uncharacterized protein n=1 Tax=Eumeta variegata TaxID=151549 RepID=A0A4C1V1T5_EUMVA|nr:hypothetical protein EVAR_27639_1 [Eumeta japonica]